MNRGANQCWLCVVNDAYDVKYFAGIQFFVYNLYNISIDKDELISAVNVAKTALGSNWNWSLKKVPIAIFGIHELYSRIIALFGITNFGIHALYCNDRRTSNLLYSDYVIYWPKEKINIELELHNAIAFNAILAVEQFWRQDNFQCNSNNNINNTLI